MITQGRNFFMTTLFLAMVAVPAFVLHLLPGTPLQSSQLMGIW